MENIKEIQSKIEAKFPSLVRISDCEIIGNIICVSCYVKTNSNYFIIYPNGEVRYRTKDNWDYISDFNKDDSGNGIAFIDSETFDLIKVYYYKDDLNFDWQISITTVNENYIVTAHEERTHVIFLDNFSVTSFGGLIYKVFQNYILFFPYWGYSCYNTLAILNTNTKKRVDLNQKLASIIEGDLHYKENGNLFEPSITINEKSNNLVYKYLHSGEIFEINLEKLFSENDVLEYSKSIQNSNINYNNLQLIEGEWAKGFSLDIHTIKSSFNADGSFDTERSLIGELLYKIKYRFDKAKINELVDIIAPELIRLFPKPIDVLIPVPPTNLNRPFQPLIEIATELSNKTQIPIDSKLVLKKKATPSIKQINNHEERKAILSDAFFVNNKTYKGKTVLIFDDLYRSGETLNAVAKTLKEQGEVGDIYVLTITKTRTKR